MDKVNPQLMAMIMNGQIVPTRQLVSYRLTFKKRKRGNLIFDAQWFLSGTNIAVSAQPLELIIGAEESTITIYPPSGDFPRPFVLTDIMRVVQ